MRGRLYAIAALLALTSAGLRAQGDRGIITGTVKDASGAVLPGADVTATHLDTNTNYKTNTTASGDFTVPALPVGNYRVRVESTRVQDPDRRTTLWWQPAATVRLDMALELGTTQQTIEVQANAQMLQTETARVSTEVSNRLVDDLPMVVNGAVRSPFDLAATTAEAQGSGDYQDFRDRRRPDWRLRRDAGRHRGHGRTSRCASELVGRSTPLRWRPSRNSAWSPAVSRPRPDTPPAAPSALFPNRAPTNFTGTPTSSCAIRTWTREGFFGATKPVYKQNDFGVTAGRAGVASQDI